MIWEGARFPECLTEVFFAVWKTFIFPPDNDKMELSVLGGK